VGRRNDVDLWLAAADVVVVPSRWEGMSLVMLEAMARGCCVVSTNIAGASEALAEGAGAVVPLGDGVSLARAIVERLTDGELRRVEGRAARRRAESLFSHERMAQGIAETYEEVLARRASQGGRAKE
jgi:glycosyltransferase involved in cell wall biosynthesis